MTEYKTTCDIRAFKIPIGDARRDDRQPSHNGEYLTVYSAGPGCWVAEGNGGAVCSDVNSNGGAVCSDVNSYADNCREVGCTDGDVMEAEEIDAEIAQSVADNDGEFYPAGSYTDEIRFGGEATEYMMAAGVLKAVTQ